MTINRYKRFITILPLYPGEQSVSLLKERVKRAFKANIGKSDSEIEQALARGNYVYKEVEALIQLKKYRTLDKRYSSHRQEMSAELLQYLQSNENIN